MKNDITTGWLAAQGRKMMVLCLGLLLVLSLAATSATAGWIKTYTKKADFDDIRFELTNAIIDKGFKVQDNGHIAEMLERTGGDVGSSKAIYKSGEYFTFCSAKLSRAMMEADPRNIGYCPFVVFIYVSVKAPDTVVVGYQTHPVTGNVASVQAFAAIDKMLDSIVRQVVQ